MAPFWTDLDGTSAPGFYIATLTDGVNTWIVAEYAVKVWGTNDQRAFQVWIGINGVQDIVYEYAANQADPAGQPFLVGAENALGQGDMEAVLPTTAGLTVTSTPATPGGVLNYSFQAKATGFGEGDLVTEMNASGVRGVTIARTLLRIGTGQDG